MSMTWFDGFLALFILIPLLLGLLRGVQAVLVLFIMIWGSFLSVLLLIEPLERFVERVIGMPPGVREYPLAETFFLEDRTGAALAASFLPGLLFALGLFVFFLIFKVVGQRFSWETPRVGSRLAGFFLGIITGLSLNFMLAALLFWLPWPFGSELLRGSGIITFFLRVIPLILSPIVPGY